AGNHERATSNGEEREQKDGRLRRQVDRQHAEPRRPQQDRREEDPAGHVEEHKERRARMARDGSPQRPSLSHHRSVIPQPLAATAAFSQRRMLALSMSPVMRTLNMLLLLTLPSSMLRGTTRKSGRWKQLMVM